MIPQKLEKKIVDAIKAALEGVSTPVQIFGAWQPSLVGYLKNHEEADTVAMIAVALGTQQRATFSIGTVGFTGVISLTVRVELDTTGEALLSLAAPIEAMLRAWQGETYQQAFTALDVPGFQLGDISFTGGNAPQFDFVAKTVTVDWPFTISGSDAD